MGMFRLPAKPSSTLHGLWSLGPAAGVLGRMGLLMMALGASSCTVQNLYSGEGKASWPTAFVDSGHPHCLAPGDKLSLSVWRHEEHSIGSLFGIYNSNEVYGKWVLVDEGGYALFPGLGKMHLLDLTVEEAETLLADSLSLVVKDPQLVLRVLNREVDVLGEVRNPGTYLLERENHSLSELLSRAGGMEPYADITDVHLFRNGQDYHLDLTAVDANPELTLRNGDIITIPSRRGKMLDRKAPTLIPFTSAITAIVLVASLVISNSN